MQEPSIGLLASAAGLAGVIWLVMQLVRTLLDAATFDRFGAIIAALVGVAFALAYVAVSTDGPVAGEAILQAVLVGLFGGALSQNVNHLVSRTAGR